MSDPGCISPLAATLNRCRDLYESWEYELVKQKRADGNEDPYDISWARKDGSRILVEVCGREIPYKGGKVRAVSCRDITERF